MAEKWVKSDTRTDSVVYGVPCPRLKRGNEEALNLTRTSCLISSKSHKKGEKSKEKGPNGNIGNIGNIGNNKAEWIQIKSLFSPIDQTKAGTWPIIANKLS